MRNTPTASKLDAGKEDFRPINTFSERCIMVESRPRGPTSSSLFVFLFFIVALVKGHLVFVLQSKKHHEAHETH